MEADWRPTAGLETLRIRARVLAEVRTFFAERDVLEVETPVLGNAAATDPHLVSLTTCVTGSGGASDRRLYLQTSPELAMKRLLAAGSGPIYQICKSFRDGESGRLHNPEFTMLEWYRPGFDHHRLMDEVDELLRTVLELDVADRRSYRQVMVEHAGVDPLEAGIDDLRRRVHELVPGAPELDDDDRDGWLDLLLTHVVEPHLGGGGRASLVVDFPASQAALARIRSDDPRVCERFEAWVEGVELANGYHELVDPEEQRRRCRAHLAERSRLGLPPVPVDEAALAALEHGLPVCAGVALGLDRLVMLAAGAERIEEVIAFPVGRA